MDSSDSESSPSTDSDSSTSASASSDCDSENESVSTMVQSQRARFFETYKRQSFSLPESIMFYIAKNPTSAQVYQKLIQSCKDFFVKNPILVISDLDYVGDEWHVNRKPNDLENLTSKLWITSRFCVQPNDSINNKAVDQSVASSLLPKIYRCDVELVALYGQVISLADLSRFISTAKFIWLHNVVVKENDGANVGIEKIVAVAFKAKKIDIYCPPITSITSKTMKELVKISNFCKLDDFTLSQIPETFDIEAFYVYMKKNQHTSFGLDFVTPLSDAYKNRLEQITDEIIAAEIFTYKPPYIDFEGISSEKADKLHRIYLVHL